MAIFDDPHGTERLVRLTLWCCLQESPTILLRHPWYRMFVLGRLLAALSLVSQAATACAQSNAFPSREGAIAALFPTEKFVEWTSTDGDWNGDGIKDLAMILNEVDGPVD